MIWTIELDADVSRSLRKLDSQIAHRLLAALKSFAALDDPRSKGKPLTGPLKGYWRYRIGDYRLICDIHDAELVIVAIDLGHRSKVYDR